ncbi:hypothetical protein ACF073_23855 [Streptomyces sp. NPDC015171]|uniref:hypothetical protein n=1 Tax=Streptomyces sp. NPDC015171 TaxID=3364945 RepID=UPI0036F96509
MKHELLLRLAESDAAPRTELSAAEVDRKERLLQTVLSDTEQPGRSIAAAFRRPLVRRVAFTMAGALAASAALLVVPADPPGQEGSGPLTAPEVATWTGTAGDLNDADGTGHAALGWCLDKWEWAPGEGGGGDLTNVDIRGSIASMIVTRYSHTAYCLAGSDGSGVAVAIGPAVEVPADGITVDAQGARGSGAARFHYAVGSMGSGVKEITVRDHGRTVHATVRHIRSLYYGRWTAWWPDSDSDNALTGTLTLTLDDGTTRTVNADSLMK